MVAIPKERNGNGVGKVLPCGKGRLKTCGWTGSLQNLGGKKGKQNGKKKGGQRGQSYSEQEQKKKEGLIGRQGKGEKRHKGQRSGRPNKWDEPRDGRFKKGGKCLPVTARVWRQTVGGKACRSAEHERKGQIPKSRCPTRGGERAAPRSSVKEG